MNAREYSLAEVLELWAAVESRRKAENGDPAMLLERLGARRATQHELDQAFLAGVFGGTKKRGRRVGETLHAKQQQATFFHNVLTSVIGLSSKAASGRLADFFGTGDRTIDKWVEQERKRAGDGWPAKVAANLEHFDFWRPALMAEKRIAALLEAAK